MNIWIIWISFCLTVVSSIENYDEILYEENEKFRIERYKLSIAQWNYETNITEHNEELFSQAYKAFDEFRKQQYQVIKKYLNKNDFKNMTEIQKRQFEKLGFLGFSILDEKDGIEFKNVQVNMEKIYSSAKINIDNRKDLSLDPDLNNILRTSVNESLLKKVWIKFRDETGKKMRQDFISYRRLGNKAAQILNKGIETIDDVWMFSWENDNIKKQTELLMNDLMDLYKKIHAYVRFHLTKVYKNAMPSDGTIPAHLLGNMWGQTWSNILTLIPEMQFNSVVPLDEIINKKLKNWTVKQMFELSENFFTSLGMKNMTKTFWNESIIEKRNGVDMVCHPSAWDFFQTDDFRIKQCTVKTFEHLLIIHHEMGHIQYYMNYKKQPAIFRDGANPGFHEAIGDLMALSVVTPKHLTKIGLLDKEEIDKNFESLNLNYQLRMALDKIVFLPFSFLVDKWRWDVFQDSSLENRLNRHWWELRLKYQGISPPVKRSEEDFDPGAKYHIAAGVEYIRYFVSHILQFQFYKHLCNYEAVGKLYECDFYSNKRAGEDLMIMLQKGSSDKWENILKDFIGKSRLSLNPLYEYFEPLNQTLSNFIEKNKIKIGWNAKVEDYFVEERSKSHQNGFSFIILSLSIFICLMFN